MSKKVTLNTEHAVRKAIEGLWAPPAYAVLPSVPNGTGGHKTRTIDALVMSLWPSRGLTLDAVEIKTSRSDWLRELEQPAKAETFFEYVDHFWLAVGDADIVQDGELPPTWGLLVPSPRGAKMRIAKAAPALTPKPLPRSFLAAMFRRMSEAATAPDLRRTLEDEIRADVSEQMAELQTLRTEKAMREMASRHGHLDEHAVVREFLALCDITVLASWSRDAMLDAAKVCRLVAEHGPRAVLSNLRWSLDSVRASSERTSERARESLASLDAAVAEFEQASKPPGK